MRRLILAVLFLAASGTVQAQENVGLAVGLRAGTMGPGAEIAFPIGNKLNIRGGGTLISLNQTHTEEDEDVTVEFEADVTWGGFRALVDYHPFGNAFRLTGGAYIDKREVTASGTPTSEFDIDGKIFQPERLGSMSVTLGFDQAVSPYAGIGLGDPTRGARVGFMLDLGVIYQGSPTFDMSGTGMIAPTANFGPQIEAGIESFKWMPVVSLGLSIRIL